MAATYFHKVAVGSDLSSFLAIHREQYPGNELAKLEAKDGDWIVKVAYPDGTEKPEGAMTLEEARGWFPVADLG